MKKFILAAAAALMMTSAAVADHLSFSIVNRSGDTVVQAFASNVNRHNFEPYDILGNAVVYPRRRVLVEPAIDEGYCRFDVRLEFDTGRWQEVYNVNLCNVSEVIVDGHRAWTK